MATKHAVATIKIVSYSRTIQAQAAPVLGLVKDASRRKRGRLRRSLTSTARGGEPVAGRGGGTGPFWSNQGTSLGWMAVTHASFAPAFLIFRQCLRGFDALRERHFDRLPSSGKLRVALRQRPERVHVVGQHHPGVDIKRHQRADPAHRGAQQVDLLDEWSGATVLQVYRKEIAAPGDTITTVVMDLLNSAFLV